MNSTFQKYPQDFDQKIGFDKICLLLEKFCASSLGKEHVKVLAPTASRDDIQWKIDTLEELVRIFSEEGISIPEQGFFDLRHELDQLKAEGNWWEPESFIELRSLLRTSQDLLRIFVTYDIPVINELHGDIDFPKKLLSNLEKVFNEKGELSDHASPELAKIRKTIEQNRQQVRKSLELIFRNARQQGFVPEGSSISIRDGRMVIPVVAEAKRKIRGFIHDESATGQTVYIEPAAVLEGNNKQRELEYEERREVIRILKQISAQVGFEKDTLIAITRFMGEIDFLRAKIKLAEILNAIKPALAEDSTIQLVQARHPLLIVSNHHVVPLNISLNARQRIVLISGPNAGGKSVALKTVALLQYMLQCGLFVPVGEGSQLGVFEKIFIDIGDEQSIENDLSTYSSHLKNMRHMLTNVNDKTLLLIDEFGSGTEPHFGGALAESMLEKFRTSGARGVITTHYANLKTFAESYEGVINAAMLFDIKKLKPLYQLTIGKPGSSHALDIAYNTGLSSGLIERAKELLGRETIDYDKALSELQAQLKTVEEREQKLIQKEKQTEQLKAEFTRLKEKLEKNEKQIISTAKAEAEAIVSRANREIEKTIRHIKENRAEKKETRKIRQRLEGFKQQKNIEETENAPVLPDKPAPLQQGDYVELKDSHVMGQILQIQGNTAEVLLGDLKTLVKLNRLNKSTRKEVRQQRSGRRGATDFSSKLASFSSTLDIRGKRAEEAISIVDKFIDDALLAGAGEVKILHGKGNGILKDIVRNHLKSYRQVENMADEHIERGGAGITVVTLAE